MHINKLNESLYKLNYSTFDNTTETTNHTQEVRSSRQSARVMKYALASEPQWLKYLNNSKGWPALHYAIECNDMEAVKILSHVYPEQIHQTTPGLSVWYFSWGDGAEQDHDYYVDEERGSFPLELAVRSKNLEMVQWLIDHGADLNVSHKIFRASGPLWIRLDKPVAPFPVKDWEMVWGKMYGSPLNYDIYTPLYDAIQAQDSDMVQFLLDQKVDLTNVHVCATNYDPINKIFWPEPTITSALQLAASIGEPMIIEQIKMALEKQDKLL